MHCPTCFTQLQIADRAGIEIDFCPSCRGIWLEKGELDKIVERSAEHFQPIGSASPQRQLQFNGDRRSSNESKPKKKSKRRESWLEELFDVFD